MEELLEMAISGDSNAFEELMNDYMNNIYNYILLKISNKEDVKDVLQETILATWKGLKKFKKESSFKTWVIGIAKYKIMDFYRRKYNNSSFEILETEVINTIEYSEDGTDNILDRIDIENSISSLDKSQRELLFLIFNCQFTYSEIENMTGIPKGTIKSRFYYLKKELRPQLEEGRDEYD